MRKCTDSINNSSSGKKHNNYREHDITSDGMSIPFTGSALLISVNKFSTAGMVEVRNEYTSIKMLCSSAGQLSF